MVCWETDLTGRWLWWVGLLYLGGGGERKKEGKKEREKEREKLVYMDHFVNLITDRINGTYYLIHFILCVCRF